MKTLIAWRVCSLMTKTRDTLVDKYGSEEAYRQHMRDIRSKVKNHPGGSFRDKKLAKAMSKKALEARWNKPDADSDKPRTADAE